jgi:asparagine synthase (glutamine-hydrolysing)
MCGIYGMLHLSGASAAPEALRPMARRTIHRGPDDEGVYAHGPLTFGMRRLSIIDVPADTSRCPTRMARCR